MFAKMLLNMVISKHLEAPFDRSPKDGPLPPFPREYKAKLKEMIGPHEASFWREIYSNVNTSKAADATNRSNSNNRYGAHNQYHIHNSVDETLLSRREHDNIMFLNQELDRKVLLLEQQLQEERLRHELEIQKLLSEQRSELMKIKDTTNKMIISSPNISKSLDSNLAAAVMQNRMSEMEQSRLNESKSRIILDNNLMKPSSPKKSRPHSTNDSQKQTVSVKASNSSNASLFTVPFNGSKSDILPSAIKMSPSKTNTSAAQFLQDQENIFADLTQHSNNTLLPHKSFSVINQEVPANEDDFMRYLEDFQKEIKSLQYKT
jgi:hypothetical protein